MEKPVFLLDPYSNLLETSRIKLPSGSLIFSILKGPQKKPGYIFAGVRPNVAGCQAFGTRPLDKLQMHGGTKNPATWPLPTERGNQEPRNRPSPSLEERRRNIRWKSRAGRKEGCCQLIQHQKIWL